MYKKNEQMKSDQNEDSSPSSLQEVIQEVFESINTENESQKNNQKLPVVKWINYFGCTILIVYIIRRCI